MNPNDEKRTCHYLAREEGKSNGEQYLVLSSRMRVTKMNPRQPPSAVPRAKVDYFRSKTVRNSENEFTTMFAPALRSVLLSNVVVIAAEKHPAAFAARNPFTESSTIQQSAACNCNFSNAIRNTSGSGFGR